MSKVIYKFGDDISTDIIYPGRFMATVLPSETPEFAFADEKDLNKLLNSKTVPADSIIIGGKNFGCGSSREQACSTLKGHELIIIAKNFARIFLQNSINLGLKTVICPDIDADVNDELEISEDKVFNKTKGKEYNIIPHTKTQQEIIQAGGLIPYSRKRLIEGSK
ncbi:3-isopropylmalate dehydratase [Bacteroidetes/Chlorobi group bacterium ChocPot_Mid]|jgi:3-isopropylmalate/(R)-2-methylmalate dehydratase small subunit|nr:MAG: 3-isopropylmalate dehydratase [Bacteroidetes/Chlorobi group bacterium ChocPot_Mid]